MDYGKDESRWVGLIVPGEEEKQKGVNNHYITALTTDGMLDTLRWHTHLL